MKTYKEFTQDLEENKTFDKIKNTVVKNYNRIPKPVRTGLRRVGSGLFRLNYADDAIRNPNKDDLLTRATSAVGVVKPFSSVALFGPDIINQGKRNSMLNKAANYIDKKVTKITGGRLSSNPDTHFGRKISDFTGKKLDQILQRRNQNRGANELKGSTSSIS